MRRYGGHIAGSWSSGTDTRQVVSPVNGEVVYEVIDSDLADLDAAVGAAREVLISSRWSYDVELRTRVMYEFTRRVREETDSLATAVCEESGKLYGLAKSEARRLANSVEYFAGAARWLFGRSISPNPETLNVLVPEAVGVVGVIMPWNMPLGLMARALAPALAAGNAVVLKPDELTVGSTARALELLVSIPELPAGVVNLVAGGDEIGKAMTTHPGIDMIAFTGSSDTGKAVMASCATTLKKVSLELGGKSPVIVFEDADIEAALNGVSEAASFYHAGQICLAGTRILVQDGIYESFTSAVAERARALRVGDGAQRGVQCGPLMSRTQMERVLAYIETGKSEATLVAGGYRLSGPEYERGNFVAPTVFADVGPTATIAQEEIFGPVLSVLRFGDLDEATAVANNTRFGLAAGVFTRDIDKALAMARRVRAGTVWVNSYAELHQNSEMGGMKESGLGRQYGLDGLYEYTETKNISLHLDTGIMGLR